MESLESALALLLKHAAPISRQEMLPLEMALGRVLQEDIHAPMNLPPFDRSPLDGYALRALDIQSAAKENPVTLQVIGELCAGCPDVYTAQEGQAVRIMTGAPVPYGCDCVVRQEDVVSGEDTVTLFSPLQPGQNICLAGEDVAKGSLVLHKGQRLSAVAIGVLAGLGITEAAVFAPVKAALLSTGDELAKPGQPLKRGSIYNINGPMLSARLAEIGVECVTLSPSGDDARSVAGQLLNVLPQVDIVITTGGVSVGKKDILHEVLDLMGARRLFWRIAMKPGSPLLAGVLEGKLLICLSGNPFAALACFELFAKPVLLRLKGEADPCNRRIRVPLTGAFQKPSPSRRLIRAVYDGVRVHAEDKNHSSGSLASMIGCNCLIDIPAGCGGLVSGDEVEIVLI